MSVLNGTLKRLKIGDVTIGNEFQSSLDVEMDLPTTLSKDDSGWNTFIMGVRSGSLSVSCYSDESETINFESLTEYIVTKQTVSFAYEDATFTITGTGLIEDASEIAENESVTRYDISIKIQGAAVQSAAVVNYLLLETGDFLLLENGDKLILE